MKVLFVYNTFMQFIDNLSPMIKGILEAMLKGDEALKVYIIVFNFIGIPLTLFIMFYLEMEMIGAWIGITI